jgi:uncharacterized protein (DUF2141 family)
MEDSAMCPDDTGAVPGEEPGTTPQHAAAGNTAAPVPAPAIDAETRSAVDRALREGIFRRSFLKAAALGSAAAALFNRDIGSLQFGPLVAYANDLSTNPCTAEDVEIVGPGFVVNEPCTCSGTFKATVQFTVRNNTSTGRYCICLHLVPDGTVLKNPLDLVLKDGSGSSTAPGKSGGARFRDTTMFAEIDGFPCNAGVVCFGQAGVTQGKCAPGACTTIAWNTSPGAASCASCDQSPPGGQCRHQQICIVGYGVTLTCTAGCTPTCGGQATLQACVGAADDQLPITLTLTDQNNTVVGTQTVNSLTNNQACVNFTVTLSQSTTYTVTAKDKKNCTRASDPVTLNATPLGAPTIAVTAGPDCNGNTTLKATPSGGSTPFTFEWKVDGTTQSTTGDTLSVQLSLGTTHTIGVKVTDKNGCSASNSTSVQVNAAVAVSAGTPTVGCTDAASNKAQVTLTGSASGGAGGFTLTWKEGATALGTGSPLTATLGPGSHTITLTATDSAGCSASTNVAVTVDNPVSVSASAGTPGCPDGTGKSAITLTASASGGTAPYTFNWSEGGTSLGTGSSITPSLSSGKHTITVVATDGKGCTASGTLDVTIPDPVTVSLAVTTNPDCKGGGMVFTATPGGGTGGYSFVWKIDGTQVTANDGSLTYPATVDCAPHTVSVQVTDSRGCASNIASKTVTQTVNTAVS